MIVQLKCYYLRFVGEMLLSEIRRFLLEFRIEAFTDIILVFEICLFGFPTFILPGTIIMSDAWRAYNGIEDLDGGSFHDSTIIPKVFALLISAFVTTGLTGPSGSNGLDVDRIYRLVTCEEISMCMLN
ncbi:hypothetical protein QE152_g22353 [Popillia japonica]|uniref:Uncharacterized protein n=1 Tax=Popillia japonica TaxID=7064 RepID=A0AAW1KKY1_POPJA